jgi:hypothetical protein
MNRILIAALVVFIAVGAYFLWKKNATGSAFGSGDVMIHDADRTKPDTASLDSGGEEAHPTSSRSDAPGTINTEQVGGENNNQPGAGQYPPSQAATPSQAAAPKATTVSGSGNAPPTSDTIAPNPPNGEVFTGTGKYQWYRQGNLTWRVNSATGSACIAFATMEEWEKSLVYSHGCGNS